MYQQSVFQAKSKKNVKHFQMNLPSVYCNTFSMNNVLQDLRGETLRPGPEVIKLFSCSTQLRLKFILLKNVKMPTIVGILTFISRINY